MVRSAAKGPENPAETRFSSREKRVELRLGSDHRTERSCLRCTGAAVTDWMGRGGPGLGLLLVQERQELPRSDLKSVCGICLWDLG